MFRTLDELVVTESSCLSTREKPGLTIRGAKNFREPTTYLTYLTQ